jgi:plastocyanin
MWTRRHLLEVGGGTLAAFLIRPLPLAAASVVEISMHGSGGGSHVWFEPVGLHVAPGQTLRWTNADAGNSHTVTAYHPRILDRPRRIPDGAEPWDSDYLLPGESFEVTLTIEGVYDYYCIPHEHAGMVGRIVVGRPLDNDPYRTATSAELEAPPDVAIANFPAVDKIIAEGQVAL